MEVYKRIMVGKKVTNQFMCYFCYELCFHLQMTMSTCQVSFICYHVFFSCCSDLDARVLLFGIYLYFYFRHLGRVKYAFYVFVLVAQKWLKFRDFTIWKTFLFYMHKVQDKNMLNTLIHYCSFKYLILHACS